MEKSVGYFLKGSPFQILLMTSFMYRISVFGDSVPMIVDVIDTVGIILFSYCLWVLYIKGGRCKNIIVTGPFRYTRHPMYTGLALMDLRFWFATNLGPDFWISSLIFYVSLVMAGYYQEKETLTRFGSEAENYYSKTPRLFIFYPFINCARK